MAKEKTQQTNRQQGFTLLEILVVVAIMGFLVAMVAPRFAGMVDGTRWTVADTSKTRGEQMISSFYEQNGHYPSGMVNLVMTSGDDLGTATYQIPYADNEDPEDGPEVLRYSHNNNHKFVIHHLNEEEAAELRDLGITRLYNLNQYGEVLDDPDVNPGDTVGRKGNADHTGRTTNWANVTVVDEAEMRPMMEAVAPAEGVGVAMAVVGAAAHDDTEFSYVGVVRPPSAPRADSFGRIALGIGPESELVTSGMAGNAGVTPIATTTENYTYDNYYFFLPRLEATSDRLKTATFVNLTDGQGGRGDLHADFTDDTSDNFGKIVAVGYPKGTSLQPPDIVNPSGVLQEGVDQYKKRVVDLFEPHEPWDFMRFPLETDTRWSLVFSAGNL